uniref:hypothetical protein n=1 Tax=Chamaesiphon sp. OTE_20_metabat_361 TaxID=2964689 RepID=UPI00286AE786
VIATQILAVGILAMGTSMVTVAPAQAIAINSSDITFETGISTFFADVNPGIEVAPGVVDTISINFGSATEVASANGLLAKSPFFTVTGTGSPPYNFVLPTPTATFRYISGDNANFTYELGSDINFNFTNGLNLFIASGTRFNGSRNARSVGFFTIDPTGSSFKNGTDTTPLNALSFGFNDIDGASQGTYGITASTVEPTASVSEPLTIVGTILGGAAAVRISRKLTDAAKE